MPLLGTVGHGWLEQLLIKWEQIVVYDELQPQFFASVSMNRSERFLSYCLSGVGCCQACRRRRGTPKHLSILSSLGCWL